MKKDLTKELLHELFDYCDERGILIWKKRRGRMNPGSVAGRKHYRTGYIDIAYNGVKYGAHRMIWIYHNSAIEDGMVVDHINGVVDDNRISNLQVCTHAENISKRIVSPVNISGVSGVSWNERSSRWISRITHNKVVIHIGSFKDFESAKKARLEAELELFGEFAPSLHLYTGQPKLNDSNRGEYDSND